jgi:hypothetical protein
MSITKTKKGPGRPTGSKNKVQKNTSTNTVKRGRGRPKGSKNKLTANNASSVKRGRGRPKGAKNKVVEQVVETYELPFPNPIHESQRIENIRYMTSFYQHPDGRPKNMVNKPKKRVRKPTVDLMDDEKLIKGDLDTDHLVYTEKDVQEELGRMDGFVDMSKNRSRYSDSF